MEDVLGRVKDEEVLEIGVGSGGCRCRRDGELRSKAAFLSNANTVLAQRMFTLQVRTTPLTLVTADK